MKRTTLEVIAPSVDDAINRGLEQLGVSREMLDIEILDEGSKGFLGIGGRQARLRLTLKGADVATEVEDVPLAGTVQAASQADPVLEFATQTTSELLEKMKVKARVTARYGEPDGSDEVPVMIDVHGDDLSILIGRRAETLNAIQYILALIISKEANHWVQVQVDVEGYRARRERQLRQLARRMAEQAIRTGKRQLLEPMSAAERRIIHLELRGHDTVTTESIGEEPNRKVSIILKK
ncbi:MAG TPA: RNA-binding cell elongation regulator Jag/EloR [Anaerolineales bacterium]|jgi:spoIIIJ-associated protein